MHQIFLDGILINSRRAPVVLCIMSAKAIGQCFAVFAALFLIIKQKGGT